MLIFLMENITTIGINFYNLTNSSISFNKRNETNIKKILRKEAEEKYAEN